MANNIAKHLKNVDTPYCNICSDLDKKGLLQILLQPQGPATVTCGDGEVLPLNPSALKILGSFSKNDPLAKENSKCATMGMKGCYVLYSLSEKKALNNVPVGICNTKGHKAHTTASTILLKDGAGTVTGCIATLGTVKSRPILQNGGTSRIIPDILISETLLENFPTPFFTVDKNLVVTRMNRPLEILSGYSRNEVLGKMKCSELLSTPQCNTGDCLLKQSMEKQIAIAGVRKMVKNRKGQEIPTLVNASIITDFSGRLLGGFETFQDISELEKTREELEKTRSRLLQTEKAGAVGRFAAGLSHALNNPLTGILNYADLVTRAMGDDHSSKDDMEQIVEQALKCKDLLGKLTILSRKTLAANLALKNGVSSKPQGLVDVNGCIRECLRNMDHVFLPGEIKLILNLQTNLPAVRGSRDLILHVMDNLVGNAIDSLEGGGTIRIETKFDLRRQQVVTEIEDTGCGIAEEVKSQIFEPFYSTKSSKGETGLGLAIVQQIVLEHDGSIEVNPASSGGTVFSVYLPLEPRHETP